MTWDGAYRLARQLAAEKGYRWYVRGYRSPSGSWRYAAHSTPPRLVLSTVAEVCS